jgi:hypothetical protein
VFGNFGSFLARITTTPPVFFVGCAGNVEALFYELALLNGLWKIVGLLLWVFLVLVFREEV